MTPLEQDLYIEQKEAQFRLVNDQMKFQAEARQGREMDMDASVEADLEASSTMATMRRIVVNTLEPTYTS